MIKLTTLTFTSFSVLALAALPSTVLSFVAQLKQQPTFTSHTRSTWLLFNEQPTLGAGGMADTRDPDALEHDDPRKSISAAPSFEEYLKMRQGGDGESSTPAATNSKEPVPASTVSASPSASTPSTTIESPSSSSSSGSSSSGSSSSSIDALKTSQKSIVSKIASAIPELEVKPDFTLDGILIAGNVATLDARDAPGPANVAWLSALDVSATLSSLTVFNGPLTDVPHLVLRVYIDTSGNKLRFTVDFKPRAYGAYEMKREDGSYPGPDELGRQSFEYSGARNEFESKFGTSTVQDYISSLPTVLEGATMYDSTPTELDLLTRGPLYTCLEMPLTDGNINGLVSAREQIVDFWLEWRADPQNEHRPGAPINSQYVYDTKFKQNCFGSLEAEYSSLFGPDDGKKLAVADSGPLDEAYVGGAS